MCDRSGEQVTLRDSLVFRGRLNEEDVYRIHRYLWRLAFRRPFRWLAFAFLTLFAVGGMWWAVETGTPLAGLWFVLVWAVFSVAWQLEQRWSVRRYYRTHETDYLETEVTLGGEWIRIENESLRSELKWPLVGLVINAPEGLLFCDRANQCLFWLPERILDGSDLREQVLRLARSNEVLVRRMS